MIESSYEIRVRYAETDKMGYVYYGNYATYFEVARVELFRKHGVSYKEMEEEGIMMPVLEQKTKFVLPAKYDDLLTVVPKIPKKPGIRVTFEYEVFNEKKELLTIASTTLVFIDMKTGKPTAPPSYFEKILDENI